jgi:hypothetical protein
MTIAEARAKHPMPWTSRAVGLGCFNVFDRNGQEVPIPTFLSVLSLLTSVVAGQGGTVSQN